MTKAVAATANDDFSLDLKFDDGSVRRFYMTPYLEHGIFTELKDINFFKKVKVAFGTVQWPNEQNISPETLYLESVVISESSFA
ncbi:MAG: hypothetical protein AUG51_05865 [Acidobacteria bacterium 13_1_20CM_3_53_8]|nr:MAG: hypothetical protein AUG51_05865 [Acidobacteria bacterium 13_1_20CM_3_53_8]